MKADLHIHSTISDGSDTITLLLEKACQKDLTHISLTDHDTASGIPEAVETGRQFGIIVIPGVEFSAYDYVGKVKAHILGYGMKDLDAINRLGRTLLARRHMNSLAQIDMLRRLGYSITPEEVSLKAGRHIYKQHIMLAMVDKDYADTIDGVVYKHLFKQGGPCDFDIEYLDAITTIKVIKAAGGLAVLAHPGQQGNFASIARFKQVGLDGLELNHHANNRYDQYLLASYAKQYNLFLTGGSDHHGDYEPGCPALGEYLCPEPALTRIFEQCQ